MLDAIYLILFSTIEYISRQSASFLLLQRGIKTNSRAIFALHIIQYMMHRTSWFTDAPINIYTKTNHKPNANQINYLRVWLISFSKRFIASFIFKILTFLPVIYSQDITIGVNYLLCSRYTFNYFILSRPNIAWLIDVVYATIKYQIRSLLLKQIHTSKSHLSWLSIRSISSTLHTSSCFDYCTTWAFYLIRKLYWVYV